MKLGSSQMRALAWSALLGFTITVFGAGVWATLATVNLASTPGIPWSVPVMAVLLWLVWLYLRGHGLPPTAFPARRFCFPGQPVARSGFSLGPVARALS